MIINGNRLWRKRGRVSDEKERLKKKVRNESEKYVSVGKDRVSAGMIDMRGEEVMKMKEKAWVKDEKMTAITADTWIYIWREYKLTRGRAKTHEERRLQALKWLLQSGPGCCMYQQNLRAVELVDNANWWWQTRAKPCVFGRPFWGIFRLLDLTSYKHAAQEMLVFDYASKRVAAAAVQLLLFKCTSSPR